MEKPKNSASKHLTIVLGIFVLGAINIFIGLAALIFYIVYLLVTYRKQLFSSKSKLNIIIVRFILPLTIIIVLSFYNKPLAMVAVLAYIGIFFYSSRAAIFSFMGAVKYSRGDMIGGTKLLKMAYDTGKAKPDSEIAYGYLQLKQGNLSEAENVFNSLLQKELSQDETLKAKSNMALVLWKKGSIDDAIAMMEDVIKDYKTSTVYGSLGYLLIEKGDLEKALAFNLEAYGYNSKNAVIVDNLGQTYYMLGELDAAEKLYKSLMATNPVFPEAYYNYSLVLEKLGRIDEAIESIDKTSNYTLSYLSTVTKEQIDSKSKELKSMMK